MREDNYIISIRYNDEYGDTDIYDKHIKCCDPYNAVIMYAEHGFFLYDITPMGFVPSHRIIHITFWKDDGGGK